MGKKTLIDFFGGRGICLLLFYAALLSITIWQFSYDNYCGNK